MKEEMEKAIEDLARALDKVCDMIDDGDFTRMMMGLSLREMVDATKIRNKFYHLGYIEAMMKSIERKVGDAADEKVYEALEALHRVRGMVIKEEEEA